MNTVIYARYSAGPRQTDQSIEGQLRVCTDFCKQRGLTVIDTYCDRHISGRTDERPEFQRLITDAKRKKFEAVVVYKTDRFARNKYDSAVYKRELKRNGIQIFYAAEAIPDGPEGIILESLMEGLAEYYSAELAQKIKRGMHESALKCQSTGSGRPLGYRVDEQKHFQIDPESAQTVQTIFEQYIKGESNAAICELLNSRGLRTAQGKPFNKNSINRIIKNRKYIGEYRYHDIVVEGGMPAIISKDTFNLAQAEMERRRTRKAPKSPKAEYLLAGRLFCGHCKGPMQGVSGTGKSGNKWYYYYCGNTRGENKTCDKKQVSRDRLERAVVDFTVRYILQEEVLEELARKVHAAQERQNDTASEIAFYEKKLADNKKSIANVLRAIESGAMTQTLPARLQELENEQAVILGEISFLKGKRLAFTEDQIFFALMKHLEPYPGESEQDYRRRIISDFVSEVYLYDDRLLIYFNISSEDGKLKSADLSNIEGGEFDEGLVSSTTREPDEPSVLHQREEPHRFAVRLFPFHLIASLSHEIKQHVDVLTDGAKIVSSAALASIVPGAAAHLIQELFLPHQNGVSDPLVFLYKGFQLLIFFYDTDVGQVLREGTGIEPVRLRVKVQRRQRVQWLIGVPHIGMPVIFFRRLLEASYPVLGLADRLIVVEQRLSIVTIELVGVRIAVCIVLVLERLDSCFSFQGKFFHFLAINRHREIEYNLLYPASVFPFLREHLNSLDKGLHKLLLLRFRCGMVDFIKCQQQADRYYLRKSSPAGCCVSDFAIRQSELRFPLSYHTAHHSGAASPKSFCHSGHR